MDPMTAGVAGVAGVLVTLGALAVGLWLFRAALSLVRKLVVFSIVLAIGAGLVGATVLAALAATR